MPFGFLSRCIVRCRDAKPYPFPRQENKLSTFEKDMKAFTRALDQAVLPKPKLLEVRTSTFCDCFFFAKVVVAL